MKVMTSMKVKKSMKAMKVTKSMKVMKSMKSLKSMKSSGKFSQFINKEKSQWGKTYIIDGVKYDKAIIDAAEIAVKGDGRISVEDSEMLLKAIRPDETGRSTYDPIEKRTMAYVRKHFKFTPAADKHLRSSIAKLAAAQATRTKAKMMKAIKKPRAEMKAMKVKVMKSMKAMKVMTSMKVMKSMKAMKVTKSMKVMKSLKALKSMKSMKSSA